MHARTKYAPGADALAAAAQAITRVTQQGRSADDAFTSFEQHEERSAIRAIALGTLRWYLRLAPAIDALLKDPKRLPPELRALLIAAVHQIEYSRNAPQLTVHVAVDAARALGYPRTTGLVNAVLRRFVNERETLLPNTDAHPVWLRKAIQTQWPEQADSILAANNVHPPMVLRVDTAHIEVAEYLAQLAEAGIAAKPVDWSTTAIKLEKPVAVTALPGFSEGHVSVQDAGAQLAAIFLDARRDMRVLDACAAPGGKTAHILQHTPDLAEVVALDIDDSRLDRVRENLKRLGKSATLVAADIRHWDGGFFDRILVDAPCSSTGVIRRHPDIKLLRRAEDIPALAKVQFEILAAAFRMLKPAGRLLYVTCSILREENEAVLKQFVTNEPQARPIQLSHGIRQEFGVQWLPGSAAGTDGFYYACVEKTTFGT